MKRYGIQLIIPIAVLIVTLSFAACATAPESALTPAAKTEPAAQPTPEPTADSKTLPEYHYTDAVIARGELVCALCSEQTWRSSMLYPDDIGLIGGEYSQYAGKYVGFDVFLLEQIAADMGVSILYVLYDSLSDTAAAVQYGDADISAAFFGVTDDSSLYSASDDYAVSAAGIYSLSAVDSKPVICSEDELKTARIAVVTGSDEKDQALSDYPDAQFIAYEYNHTALNALINKTVDAAVFGSRDSEFAELYASAVESGLVVDSSYPESGNDSYAKLLMMHGNDPLTEYVNECIARYRETGKLNEWYDFSYQLWKAVEE